MGGKRDRGSERLAKGLESGGAESGDFRSFEEGGGSGGEGCPRAGAGAHGGAQEVAGIDGEADAQWQVYRFHRGAVGILQKGEKGEAGGKCPWRGCARLLLAFGGVWASAGGEAGAQSESVGILGIDDAQARKGER